MRLRGFVNGSEAMQLNCLDKDNMMNVMRPDTHSHYIKHSFCEVVGYSKEVPTKRVRDLGKAFQDTGFKIPI